MRKKNQAGRGKGRGNMYLSKSGYYVLSVTINGTRHRKWTGTKSKSAASAQLAQFVADVTALADNQPSTDGYCYVAYETVHNRYKIGHSVRPQGRVMDVRCIAIADLELKAVIPGGRAMENVLHVVLEDAKIEGEWFSSTGALRRLIAEYPPPSVPVPEKPTEALAQAELWTREGG